MKAVESERVRPGLAGFHSLPLRPQRAARPGAAQEGGEVNTNGQWICQGGAHHLYIKKLV